LVSFPFAQRPWALPVRIALYCSPQEDRRRGRPHKTPAPWMQRLWQPCPGVVRGPAGWPVDAGQSLRGRCQSVRSTASSRGQEAVGTAPPPRGQATVSARAGGRCGAATSDGVVLRWRPSACRRDACGRSLVQGGGGSGGGALGLRPRPNGNAPR
jgi:hypothetical protein